MDASTIIVSYNTFDLTRVAVETALASGAGLAHEVVVVDNDSPDGSGERLQAAFPPARYPNVHVLARRVNDGFSAANNVGAAHARGRTLFFLNPDTRVLGDAVARLHAFLEAHPEAGAVGPRVLNDDGTDQPSVKHRPTLRRLVHFYLPVADLLRGRDARTDTILAATGPAEILKGCALAVRREAFDRVGGWDAAIFMYAEEDELCLRLLDAGYRNHFLREAEIVHYGGAATDEARFAAQQVVVYRSYTAFLRRHAPALVPANRLLGALGFGLRALVFGLLAHRRPARRAEYARRRHSAATLFRWFAFSYA